MPHLNLTKVRKFIFLIAFLTSAVGCTSSSNADANTTYSCVGEITTNNTEIKCRETHEKFTYFMSLGEKVDMSPEGCSWVHFNYKKMQRVENTDLGITYLYKSKEKEKFFTQSLNINKMTGAYYLLRSSGDFEEVATQRTDVAITGSCKKTDKVIE